MRVTTGWAYVAVATLVVTSIAGEECYGSPVERRLLSRKEAGGGSFEGLAHTVPHHEAQVAFGAATEDSVLSPLDVDEEGRRRKHHLGKEGWVYLIRHGEKVKKSDKTGLSERGLKRARCLRNVFGDTKHGIDHILAQDFKPDGRRRRPYETVKPLAKVLGIPLDHSCDRDDTSCAAKKIHRATRPHKDGRQGENLLVVWEHARLSDIARKLGVHGLVYPSERYDVVFKLRHGKVHAIYSEECDGLDERWIHWRGRPGGKHGKGGKGGRLIDDESWADDEDREDAVEAA